MFHIGMMATLHNTILTTFLFSKANEEYTGELFSCLHYFPTLASLHQTDSVHKLLLQLLLVHTKQSMLVWYMIQLHMCTHTLQRYILLSYWWLYLHLEPVILCGMASFPWFMLRSQRTLQSNASSMIGSRWGNNMKMLHAQRASSCCMNKASHLSAFYARDSSPQPPGHPSTASEA